MMPTSAQVVRLMISGTSMAASRKMRELAQKPSWPQAPSICSWVRGDMRVRPSEPTTSPAATQATTPETWK